MEWAACLPSDELPDHSGEDGQGMLGCVGWHSFFWSPEPSGPPRLLDAIEFKHYWHLDFFSGRDRAAAAGEDLDRSHGAAAEEEEELDRSGAVTWRRRWPWRQGRSQ